MIVPSSAPAVGLASLSFLALSSRKWVDALSTFGAGCWCSFALVCGVPFSTTRPFPPSLPFSRLSRSCYTTQVASRHGDGETVPLTIVHRRGMKLDGGNRLLLHG